MHIRPLEVDDRPSAVALLVATFRPFFEGYARPLLGEHIFRRQHGQWEQDYRDLLPTLHAPDAGRYAAVATLADHFFVDLARGPSWQPRRDRDARPSWARRVMEQGRRG